MTALPPVDNYGCRGTTIKLANGNYFDLMEPDQDLMDLSTIARALGAICRFNDHTPKFYSVAEHSVLATELASRDARNNTATLRAVLLHDAAEAFIGDIIEWLRHQFGYYRHAGTGSQIQSPSRYCDARSAGERSQWFVYVDPPYPMATRSGARLYTHEFTDNDHVELLKTLVVFPSVVQCMVSSYPNALYEAAFKAHGWRTMTYQSIDRRGNRRTEQLRMNYVEPPVLHDYQFAGRNKREREKLRRRCRNWVGGLRRMKPEHRNALLQAIETEFRPASTNWSALPEG